MKCATCKLETPILEFASIYEPMTCKRCFAASERTESQESQSPEDFSKLQSESKKIPEGLIAFTWVEVIYLTWSAISNISSSMSVFSIAIVIGMLVCALYLGERALRTINPEYKVTAKDVKILEIAVGTVVIAAVLGFLYAGFTSDPNGECVWMVSGCIDDLGLWS